MSMTRGPAGCAGGCAATSDSDPRATSAPSRTKRFMTTPPAEDSTIVAAVDRECCRVLGGSRSKVLGADAAGCWTHAPRCWVLMLQGAWALTLQGAGGMWCRVLGGC